MNGRNSKANSTRSSKNPAEAGFKIGPPSETRTPRNQLRRLAFYPDELMAVCDGAPDRIRT